jgi:hypothetical protein
MQTPFPTMMMTLKPGKTRMDPDMPEIKPIPPGTTRRMTGISLYVSGTFSDTDIWNQSKRRK